MAYSVATAQLALQLSALAYVDENTNASQQQMIDGINVGLQSAGYADWSVAWGPALDQDRSNMMYAAANTAGDQVGKCRVRTARLFKPTERLVRARLQQMHRPNLPIPFTNVGIVRTEANGLFLKRDHLVYGPTISLQWPSMNIAPTSLRLNASALSYSGMASAHRCCARSTWPLAKCASGLRGDAVNAFAITPFARAISAAAEPVKLSSV